MGHNATEMETAAWLDLDLHLIRVLHAVLTEGSVSRAALRLGMHQPAVSAALRRLRAITGDPLLVRAGGRMVPTANAQRMIGPASAILANAQAMVQQAQPFDPAHARHAFTIAASDYLDPRFLPQVVARLKAEAPHLQLTIQPLHPGADYRRWLAEGEVDVVIGNWPSPPGDLHQGRLLSDEVVCLVARHHPAVRRGWTLQEWLQAEHVAPTPFGPGLRGAIDDYLNQQGWQRNIVVRCPSFGMIPAMVSQTLLVLTTGRRYCEAFTAQLPLVVLPPPVPLPRLQYYQLWHERAHGSRSGQWLRGLIRDVAARLWQPAAA